MKNKKRFYKYKKGIINYKKSLTIKNYFKK